MSEIEYIFTDSEGIDHRLTESTLDILPTIRTMIDDLGQAGGQYHIMATSEYMKWIQAFADDFHGVATNYYKNRIGEDLTNEDRIGESLYQRFTAFRLENGPEDAKKAMHYMKQSFLYESILALDLLCYFYAQEIQAMPIDKIMELVGASFDPVIAQEEEEKLRDASKEFIQTEINKLINNANKATQPEEEAED